VKRSRRYALAGVAVLGIVGYLMVTGMRDSMLYYYTPAELLARTAADPTVAETGIRVGGRVTPGTVSFDPRTLDLSFQILDVADGASNFRVAYNGPLPDTFEEGRDVIVEGRYQADGTFHASTVLTKCGSRYEATEEDFVS
jgi:cytochrome c-type biogenesis protein CcmE